MSNAPTNLPLQLTSFVGREREMAEVKRLLCSPPSRLLTLTGTGGCGKTRLAIQVATDLIDSYPDGCWLVELASLSDPVLVLSAVASVFDTRETFNNSLLSTLVNYLRPKNLLLVLDNCEHLLEACAHLVDALLRACPSLHILTTSRQALGILGETSWRVPSMSVSVLNAIVNPGMDVVSELTQSETARLFVDRALAVLPSFRLTERNVFAVAQICRRLDGMPLAIELAAARVKTLTVEEIAQHLDDCIGLLTTGNRTALPRHQTLLATMTWSYDLLSEEERTLFHRLAVFSGGWTLEAAENVCAAFPYSHTPTLELLSRLVDKSLVVVEEYEGSSRYRMLETIRQYAHEKLNASKEICRIQSEHFDFFLKLAERADPELKREPQILWLKRMDAELDNFRSALEWSFNPGLFADNASGLRLVVGLGDYWLERAYWKEGREWIERALKLPFQSETTRLRIDALRHAFRFANRMGEVSAARSYLQARSKLVEELQDEKELARLMFHRAVLARLEHRLEEARSDAEACLELFTRLGDKSESASALIVLGTIKRSQGDPASARVHFDESLRLLKGIQDQELLETSLDQSAFAAFRAGDFQTARLRFKELLTLSEERQNRPLMRHALVNLGEVARASADYGVAKAYYEASLALARELSEKLHICCDLLNLGYVAVHQGDYSCARQNFEECIRLYQGEQLAWGVASAVEGLATLAAAQGKGELAAQLIGAANAHLVLVGAMATPADRIEHERSLVAIHALVDDQQFDSAWALGTTMSLDQAVEYALTQVTALSDATSQIVQVEIEPRLEIFGFGRARVCRGERELGAADWKYSKTRDMFFYLLCHPPRTKEQIGVMLWQDASDAQLRSNFRVALYHLRHALGRSEWILFENEYYSFNHALPHWFDVDVFEQALADARKQKTNDPLSAMRHLQSAIDLYRGDFLEGSTVEWVAERQNELQRKYLDALLMLGQLNFAQAHYTDAAEQYRKAIALDGFIEVAHRELMRCYARQGESGQALRHYQKLVELLNDEIGAAPAAETQVIYAQLQRNEPI